MMSSWLLNGCMDGALLEIRVRQGNSGAMLNPRETEQKLPQLMHVDDALLFTQSEEELARVMDHFNDI